MKPPKMQTDRTLTLHISLIGWSQEKRNLTKPRAIQLDQILSPSWVRRRSCRGEGEKYRYGLDDGERRGYSETCLGMVTPTDADIWQQGGKS
jgi:hypothetical protein